MPWFWFSPITHLSVTPTCEEKKPCGNIGQQGRTHGRLKKTVACYRAYTRLHRREEGAVLQNNSETMTLQQEKKNTIDSSNKNARIRTYYRF